jgi:hypothetical protein
MNNRFYAAKIMAIGNAFYLVEVRDHNRHVGAIAKTLGASDAGHAAALCHDLGKIGNVEREIADRKPSDAQEYINAYVDWLVKGAKLDKSLKDSDQRQRFALALLQKGTWQERCNAVKNVLNLADDRLQELIGLSVSPFPRHADGISEVIQNRPVREGYLLEAGCPPELVDYAFELIRLHHSFRVDRIVEVASRLEVRLAGVSGQQFVWDLHTLISADNLASGLYERALAATDASFSFGDPAQETFLLHDLEGECTVRSRNKSANNQLQVQVQLGWKATSDSQKIDLELVYHVVGVG